MRVSLYEIEATMRKASMGAGLSFGLAEDIGKASVWLAMVKQFDVKAILEAICVHKRTIEMHNNVPGVTTFPNAQSALCGVSAIELLLCEADCSAVQLTNADSELLLAGFAGITAKNHNVEFCFEFSNGAMYQISGENFVGNEISILSPSDISITYVPAISSQKPTPIVTQGIDVDEENWRKAEMLAAKTYVKQTHASRASGAGAGLTDND